MEKLGYITAFIVLIFALLVCPIVADKYYRMGLVDGRHQVYESFAARPSDGTCFVKGGCK